MRSSHALCGLRNHGVGAQHSIEIQKYGITDSFSIFKLASVRIIGLSRVN